MNRKFLILILLIFSVENFSQWDISISYNLKNEIPETGFGFQIEKKLPIQFPDFGGKLRFQAEFYNSVSTSIENNITINQNIFQSDYQLSLIFEYFFRYFYPYAGIGLGFGNFNVNQYNEFSFLLNGVAGLELFISENISPFAEIQINNYFISFSPEEFNKDFKTFVLKGIFGLRFNLNLID